MSRSTAGSAVVAALTALIVRLDEAERTAVLDEPDAVHQARILVRRQRSVLRTFRPLFDRDRVDELRESLDELGDELGDVRDIEVRVEHAEHHLDEGAPREMHGAARRCRAASDIVPRTPTSSPTWASAGTVSGCVEFITDAPVLGACRRAMRPRSSRGCSTASTGGCARRPATRPISSSRCTG